MGANRPYYRRPAERRIRLHRISAVLAPLRSASNCPALVLNADYRPLSYYPLSLWSWQDAIKAVFLERVTILEEYDRVVHSARFEMRLPSVVSLKTYIKPARNPAFTRFNVFLRDQLRMPILRRPQGPHLRSSDPALQGRPHHLGKCRHRLQPLQSRQGREAAGTGAACIRASAPHQPTVTELRERGRKFPPNYLHESWADYLYWDSELEP